MTPRVCVCKLCHGGIVCLLRRPENKAVHAGEGHILCEESGTLQRFSYIRQKSQGVVRYP